jgi:hypothetical protein
MRMMLPVHMITNKMIIFWVSPRVPIGSARPKTLEDLGRPWPRELALRPRGQVQGQVRAGPFPS